MKRSAKQAHRTLALLIGLFLTIHFATHFSALGGFNAQDSALQAGRTFYRIPLVEIALVLALGAQVALGIRLLVAIRKRRRKDSWHWLQIISGGYLAFFLVAHTSSALLARLAFELDTNFYWAAGSLVLEPLKYGFAPYYTFAVMALLSHILAALHFRRPARWHAPALSLGPIAGTAIVLAYAGELYPVELPQDYIDYFDYYIELASQLSATAHS